MERVDEGGLSIQATQNSEACENQLILNHEGWRSRNKVDIHINWILEPAVISFDNVGASSIILELGLELLDLQVVRVSGYRTH